MPRPVQSELTSMNLFILPICVQELNLAHPQIPVKITKHLRNSAHNQNTSGFLPDIRQTEVTEEIIDKPTTQDK